MEITNYQLAGAPHAMSVAVIADFHNGDPEPILAALRERRPDAILVAGDTVHDGKRFAEGLALLRRLITVAPVFCALGNHEYRCEDIEARIRRTGARLLDNSYTTLGGFVIGGLSSGYRGKKQGRMKKTPPPRLDWLEDFCAEKGTHILLCHHPEYFAPHLAHRKVELVIAGHAHGGQWRLFGQGIFAPGQGILPRFTGGLYRGRKHLRGQAAPLSSESPLLLVSRGLGNQIRIPRLWNREELVYIDFCEE